jgi:Asp/Glu/hydantoin racemase
MFSFQVMSAKIKKIAKEKLWEWKIREKDVRRNTRDTKSPRSFSSPSHAVKSMAKELDKIKKNESLWAKGKRNPYANNS